MLENNSPSKSQANQCARFKEFQKKQPKMQPITQASIYNTFLEHEQHE